MSVHGVQTTTSDHSEEVTATAAPAHPETRLFTRMHAEVDREDYVQTCRRCEVLLRLPPTGAKRELSLGRGQMGPAGRGCTCTNVQLDVAGGIQVH